MLRLALLLTFLSGSALAQSPAGVIDFADGDATVEAAGKARLAKEGDAVRVGETVTTFPKAEVHLKMADGAYVSVRENTKITISKYVANGDEKDESLIDLARGAMRSVTGWIGKYRRSAYVVRTPMVTIGVRGTDHETSHLLEGDPRGEPGTYDKVNEGATVMQSPRGTVEEVQPNRAAHFHVDRPAPRLLAEVPRFYQPAKNETRFAQRAQASVREVDTRRDEHRKARGLPPQKPPAAKAEAARKANEARNGPPSRAAQLQQKSAARMEERKAATNQKSPAARLQEKAAEKKARNEKSVAEKMQRKAEPRHFDKKREEKKR